MKGGTKHNMFQASRNGEQHWLTNEEEDERLKSRDAFVSHHPWFHQIKTMVAGKDVVSVNDVVILLSIPLERQDHKSRLIIESSLQKLGYSKTRDRIVTGKQHLFPPPWT